MGNIIDDEFAALMKTLDTTKPCVSENFERQQMQTVKCKHGINRQQCMHCKIVIKPYWPGNS